MCCVLCVCLGVCVHVCLPDAFLQSYSIALLSERKYSHFRSVLDAYCTDLFKAATVYEYVCSVEYCAITTNVSLHHHCVL